jgi:ribosomal protein S19
LIFNDLRVFRSSFFSSKFNINSKKTKLSEVYTYLRDAHITPHLIGKRVAVYNGFKFNSFIVKEWMVGKCFGVFSLTKKLGSNIHTKKKKLNIKKKK